MPDYKIDIECDGDYWHSSDRMKEKDKKRDIYLTSNGWIVIRFKGSELKNSVEKCVNIIIDTVNNRGRCLEQSEEDSRRQ